MQILLAILLYLHIINPGNTYYQSFINNENLLLAPSIELIEDDPDQMDTINNVYYPQVDTIVIIDDLGG